MAQRKACEEDLHDQALSLNWFSGGVGVYIGILLRATVDIPGNVKGHLDA